MNRAPLHCTLIINSVRDPRPQRSQRAGLPPGTRTTQDIPLAGAKGQRAIVRTSVQGGSRGALSGLKVQPQPRECFRLGLGNAPPSPPPPSKSAELAGPFHGGRPCGIIIGTGFVKRRAMGRGELTAGTPRHRLLNLTVTRGKTSCPSNSNTAL